MATKIVKTRRGVSKAKCFEIYGATGVTKTSFDVDGKKIKIKTGGSLMTDDAGVARAIEEQHGRKGDGDLIVTELEAYNEYRDRSVKRVNYMPGIALPWHKYDRDGRRVK